jgi:hypothetical protein
MRQLKVLLFALLMGLALPALADGIPATLYKNPNCGCCEEYAKYLGANGFDVTIINSHNVAQLQKETGVPPHLAGCHTTRIGPYIFEGHVPVDSVKRVLETKPIIKGLSIPGMPAGTPGMGGTKQGPLNIYYISDVKPPKVYATY